MGGVHGKVSHESPEVLHQLPDHQDTLEGGGKEGGGEEGGGKGEGGRREGGEEGGGEEGRREEGRRGGGEGRREEGGGEEGRREDSEGGVFLILTATYIEHKLFSADNPGGLLITGNHFGSFSCVMGRREIL